MDFALDGLTVERMNDSAERAPLALRSIALLETIKGLLALAAAAGLLSLRHTDLHAATDAFLLRHGINPEVHYMRLFIEGVAKATNHHAGQIAAFGALYGLVRLVEGYGLWFGKHWAEWFAVISTAIYLPLEFHHLFRRPTWVSVAIIVFNLVLIVYLAKLLLQQRAERHRQRLQSLPPVAPRQDT